MAISFDNITNFFLPSALSALNNNFDKVEQEFDKTIYRDGSKVVTGDIDMNGNRIINHGTPTSPNDLVTLEQVNEITKGPKGDAGAAGNVMASLAAFKAAATTNVSLLYNGNVYLWTLGNYTGLNDDVNIIKADSTALTTGAWVRSTAPAYVADLFGIIDDNFVSDQTSKLQAMLTYCAANRISPYFPKPARVKVTATLTYNPSDLVGIQPDILMSNLTIQTNQKTGFIVGASTGVIDAAQVYLPAIRKSVIDWTGSDTSTEAGIILNNLRWCTVYYNDVRYFTIGVQWRSENYGITHNTTIGGLFGDCRYAEVIHCVGAASYFNENKFLGGSVFYSSASTSQSVSLVNGTRFVYSSSGYRGSNNNHWYGRSYEMTDESTHVNVLEAVSIWFEGCGGYNRWIGARCESWRGPLVHVKGDVNGNVNALFGIQNDIEFGFIGPVGGDESFWYIRQVNGAYGNWITYPNQLPETTWTSGPLRDALYSGGPADGVRVIAPYILKEGLDPVNKRQLTFSNRGATNINGAQFNNGGVFVAVDTSKVKNFTLFSACSSTFEGRWFVQALDANGNILGATATDAYGTEKYIKFPGATSAGGLYGDGQISSSDNPGPVRLTVREEVKTIIFGKTSGTNPIICQQFGFTARIPFQNSTGTLIAGQAGILDLLYDVAQDRRASANPGTAGTHGIYGQGQIIANTGAASGQPSGWVCTTAGALGAAYTTSTALTVPGQIIIANGKAYAVKTAGTTASSGTGPSGTTVGTDYTDGTVVFRYIAPKAVFSALANIA